MVSAAIRHPIRVRALEILSLRDEISATTFVHLGLGKDILELKGMGQAQQVSKVSYHLKELETAKAVTKTREVKRRGVKEKFYRANTTAYFSDEEWSELPLEQRREISRVVAQGLVVQIEGAMIADTFDSRLDRWLLWDPKELDDLGWSEMAKAIAAFHAEAARIGGQAKRRLDAARREKTRRRQAEPEKLLSINATFGLLFFESPKFPELPRPEGDEDAPDD